MPGVPLWTGAAHIMPLGTITIAGAFDQVVPTRHDRIQAAKQHGSLSVQLAEHEGEGQNEDLIVKIIADMYDPVAPVFGVAPHDHRADDAGGAVARFGEVADGFAGSINPDFPGV
jgi:hypothetical protein